MAENRIGPHPELDRLVDFDGGLVTGSEAALLEAHLAACPACRLELKRMRQFLQDENDPAVLADAEWDRAELPVQRSFATAIRPTGNRRTTGRTWLLRLAPVAAAAVLAVVFLSMDSFQNSGLNWTGEDTLRGGERAPSQIQLSAPLEQIEKAPTRFAWESEREFDSYQLEVFTPDLDPVFRLADLRETATVVPDTLLDLLEPGLTYLWNVQGRSGLAEVELSLTAWFRIGPAIEETAPHGKH